MQAPTALAELAYTTKYAKGCCALVVASGTIPALFRFMRSCNRSAPHADVLHNCLTIISSIIRWREMEGPAFCSKDCLSTLTGQLQLFRDNEVTLSLWPVP